ncbi:glycosyltransferase family 2 protein [Roseomonas sp. OT10]|uniref:glycosyltransferase family 2 protein n=1 Tax=Roseomonas cutis TaxID=2897332 RepID=UPI001E4C7994|nr:glycosyltransferase family 2 protein [Roseomonas sp. OT10]UFN49754.1 glycosyltransferase family 2 protein [Roseomonas sp. OT10]
MSEAPDLSIVIVSHGHEAMLPRCADSLAPALEGLRAEIILVDNLQAGGVAAAMRGRPVTVLENTRRLGFAANVNRGAAAATGRHLLVLNPDTEHQAGRLAEAIRYLDGQPGTGMLTCRLLNPDGTVQQNTRRFPSPLFLLVRGLGGDRWRWQPGFYRRGLMREPGTSVMTAQQPCTVDWAFGAFLLLRRALFQEVGGFDAAYRLYYEDVDLARRLRRKGLSVQLYPGLIFRHEHQRSSAARPFSQTWRWHVGSAIRYFATDIANTK